MQKPLADAGTEAGPSLHVVAALGADLRVAADDDAVATATLTAVLRLGPDLAARFSVVRGDAVVAIATRGDASLLDTTSDIPLFAGGERVGVLSVDLARTEPSLASALSVIADLAASTLERLRLRAQEGEERRRLHAILAQTPIALALVRGPDHVYELSNAMNDAIAGRPIPIGRPAREVMPELANTGLFDIIERVRTTGEPFVATEMPVRVGSGEHARDLFLDGGYQPILGRDGKVDTIVAYAYDVTHQVASRKRAESLAADLELQRAALAESEARARRLQDSGVIGVVRWSRDGRIFDANDAFLAMIGYTREELAAGAIDWRAMTPPELAERDERAFAEMEEHGYCRPYEKEFLHKDGRRIPISVGVTFWEGSQTSGVAWVLDISERRALEREREAAVAAFATQRRLLQALVDHAPASIFMKNLEGRYILVNRAAAAVVGVAADAMLGSTDHELLPTEIADRFRADDRRAVERGEPVEIHEDAPVDGRRYVAHTIKFPVRDASGAVYATGGVSVDVTERIALEEALARQSLFSRTVTNNATAALFVVDAAQRCTFMNPAAQAMTGFTFDELEGTVLHDMLHHSRPDRRPYPREECPMHRSQPAGERLRGEETFVRKDGTFFEAAYATSPIASGDDARGGTVIEMRDVTEERRAQRATAFLAKASGALASALEEETILARVADVVVPERAPWTAVLLTRAEDELELASLVHTVEGGAAELRPRVLSVARSVAAREVLALRNVARLGDDVVAVPLFAHERQLGLLLLGEGADSDHAVAEELGRRLSASLDNARLYASSLLERRRAEEANRAKDELLSVTSHELRTPLNAILGWTRMLRSGKLPADKREGALERIERNARVQVQLVEDILDVSRVITGKLRLDLAPVDLHHVLEQALDVVRPAAEAKGVLLRHTVDPDIGILRGDAARLQQVLWNLVSNAVKFTPGGGEVDVSLAREGSTVVFAVKDSGQGIAPAFLPHVFEPFRQEDASMTRVHGGLGLGLAIVKHLVELHGGRVSTHSEGPGRGALMVVRLPAAGLPKAPSSAPSVTASTVPDAPSSSATMLGGVRVLVVDDERDARELVETILAASGARVTMAASASEALGLLASPDGAGFDVVVSDIGMSHASGLDLVGKLRAMPGAVADVPTVALSAYASAADRARSLASGFTAHLAKPTDARELVAVVAALARLRSRATP